MGGRFCGRLCVMASLTYRLRVGGRGWRWGAWVLGVLSVLSAAAWAWSGWRYVWVGRVTSGVLLDEGQVYVLADRKEWPDVLDIGIDHRERAGEELLAVLQQRHAVAAAPWKLVGAQPAHHSTLASNGAWSDRCDQGRAASTRGSWPRALRR